MHAGNEQTLNPELVEEDYNATVAIFNRFASGTSAFTLHELRTHLSDSRILVPEDDEGLTELLDEMRTDVVQHYADQVPPVEVSWLSLTNDVSERAYTLGLVVRDEQSRRSLQSPVSLILSQTVETEITTPETSLPEMPESLPAANEVTSATDTPQETDQDLTEFEDSQKERLTVWELDVLDMVRAGIDMHGHRSMRPRWIEDALVKFGYGPQFVHQVLRKAEDNGLIFTTTRRGQLYYTTLQPENSPIATSARSVEQDRSKRNLTDQELAAAESLLDMLAGKTGDAPQAQGLRRLIGRFQGQVSKPAMRKLIRALENEKLVSTFIDPRVRQTAAQRVKIHSEAHEPWLRNRDGILRVLQKLIVKV